MKFTNPSKVQPNSQSIITSVIFRTKNLFKVTKAQLEEKLRRSEME